MKNNSTLIGITCLLTSFVLLYACQKDLSPSSLGAAITASTTNAAVGQQVTLNIINPPGGTHLMWASTSPASASFKANGTGSSNVSFTVPGTYTVTCYFVSGAEADSIPVYDTTHNRYDTVPYYPHDTVPNYPHDTIPSYPDTVPGYPHDTVPNYPHDTVPSYPDTTHNYPHDTVPNYPHDTIHNPPDSTMHSNSGHIISKVTIVITVH